MDLIVTQLPQAELLSSNLVFGGRSQTPTRIVLNDCVFTMLAHPDVPSGSLAMNKVQRDTVGVNIGSRVHVDRYLQSPPVAVDVIIDLASGGGRISSIIDADVLAVKIPEIYSGQVFRIGQSFANDLLGINLKCTVVNCEHDIFVMDRSTNVELLSTTLKIQSSRPSQVFKHNIDFSSLSIGGLDDEINLLFKRVFASRVYPPKIIQQLGISHVKGVLLYGVPGGGKTLMARQIGRAMNCTDPKIVNGPEIMSKYVGESEGKIRELFEDARRDSSDQLHLIIFDEIDAICRKRGSGGDSTGVRDGMVNQLLTMMDGIEERNNVIVIAMTNRPELIDDALLRPGRFEVQIEVGLPDEAGRKAIFDIHLSKMIASNRVVGVDSNALAKKTKNFTGAEIAGLVRAAASSALHRNMDGMTCGDGESVMVTAEDFDQALTEVIPKFGCAEMEVGEIIDYGPRYRAIMEELSQAAKQVKTSQRVRLSQVLLHGCKGTGKTTIALKAAKDSGFPCVRVITPRSMLGLSEGAKVAYIQSTFEDAHRSELSIVIVDDLERIVEYVDCGPRFSNAVLQCLMTMVKAVPKKGHRCLVVGVCEEVSTMKMLGLAYCFDSTVEVPLLNAEESRLVAESMDCDYDDADGEAIKDLIRIMEWTE